MRLFSNSLRRVCPTSRLPAMLIALVGPQCSGKSSVQQFLIAKYGFQAVGLAEYASSPKTRPSNQTLFSSPELLLDHVTRNWLDLFVTCDLKTSALISLFLKRPFFLLVAVDAPLLVRFNRIRAIAYPNHTLDQFIRDHDTLYYGSDIDLTTSTTTFGSNLHTLMRTAHLTILNKFPTLEVFNTHLESLNLPNQERLRPNWDTYFMTLASLASQRSNCMKRRVGAILVRDRRILATGYNGTPRHLKNCNEGGCSRCNSNAESGQALDACLCLHAEENALLEAGRERVGIGAVLYCNTCPCLGCAIKIVQTGVKEVVYNQSYKVDDRTEYLLKEADIVLRQHSPPELELVP